MADAYSALLEPEEAAEESNHIGTATYSPEDNKIRIYPFARLSKEDYRRVRAAGFIWAPKQELFVAPAWSPAREDFAREMCGEIGDEDTGLVERAEAKAERLEDLSDRKTQQADQARRAVSAIADNIPFGQPILVGHHSERHARKDAARIENGMRKAVECWKAAGYWQQRAKGALRHAKYKERPDVRYRRIKGLEAEIRQMRASYTPQDSHIIMQQKGWNAKPDDPKVPHAFCGPKGRGGHWVAVEDLPGLERGCKRSIEHLENRIAYERAMLDDAGGLVAEQHEIKVGGRVLIHGEWVTVKRVNRKDGEIVSVTTSCRYVPVRGIEEVKGYEAPSEETAAAVAEALKRPPLCNYPRADFATCTEAEWKGICNDYKTTMHTIEATDTTGAHRVRYAIGFKLHLPPALPDDPRNICSANRTHTYWPVFVTDAKRKDPPSKEPEPKPAPDPDLFRPVVELDTLTARTERQQALATA